MVSTVEPIPLFIETWESRIRQACQELKRSGDAVEAKYRCTPMKNPSKAEMQAFADAQYVVKRLVKEGGI